MSEQPWTEKYRPTKTTGSGVNSIQGNTKNVKLLKRWVKNFGDDESGGKLLHGDPGVGKSSTVQAIANELGHSLLEINASDARRSDEIKDFVSQARLQTISGDLQMVLIDEVDSMSGRANLQPLYDLLDDAPNPIFLVCNDLYEVPNGVKNRCEELKFNLSTRSIQAKLKRVAKKEDIDIGASTLTQLSQRNSLRDAIQDLQLMATSDSDTSQQDFASDSRSYEDNLFDEVENILKGRTEEINSLTSSQTPDSMLLWLDQNMRDMWSLTEAMVGWDALARSDKYLQRSSDGEYRWWKYAGDLQEQVANLRLSEPYDGYTQTNSPDRFRRKKYNTERSLYQKLAGRDDDVFRMGCSFREFRQYHLDILKNLSFEKKCNISLEYGLSNKEMKKLGLSSSEFEDWRDGESGSSEDFFSQSSDSVGGFAEW